MKHLACLLAAPLLMAALPAAAATFVVDRSGAGDFTTIQAALDTVGARRLRDTVEVRAGHYDEHLIYPEANQALLVGPAGPESTTVLSIEIPGDEPVWTVQPWWTARGLGVLERFASGGLQISHRGGWERCAFHGEFEINWGEQLILRDCDFYAPVKLLNIAVTRFSRLRFHHAPLTTQHYATGLGYEDCVFEGGSADTLVRVVFVEDIWFERCSFDSASVALFAEQPSAGHFWFMRCSFTRCAVGLLDTNSYSYSYIPSYPPIEVTHCRFEQCGRAAVWPGGGIFGADTLRGISGSPAVLTGTGTIDSLDVDGTSDVALRLEYSGGPWGYGYGSVTNSSFRNIGGRALWVRESVPGTLTFTVSSNHFERCGQGADVVAGDVIACHNVAFANDGPGLHFTLTGNGQQITGDRPDSVSFNTSAFNLGHGIEVVADSAGPHDTRAVTRNIAALNAGDGIRFVAGSSDILASNDSWQNYGDDYSGTLPDATNLTLDPRFCGVLAGDLTLSAGSPGSHYTSTGPMGALGVGCDEELLGAPPPQVASDFGVWPSPARDVVEFQMPAGVERGRVDVFDAQGRRVWSADVGYGTGRVRWRGEADQGGRATAGVYWARLSHPGGSQVRRFVWLR